MEDRLTRRITVGDAGTADWFFAKSVSRTNTKTCSIKISAIAAMQAQDRKNNLSWAGNLPGCFFIVPAGQDQPLKLRRRFMMEHNLQEYLPLIHKQARFCWHRLAPNNCYDYDDLVSECFLAFVRADRSYQADKQVKFITYLWKCVQHSLIGLLQKSHNETMLLLDDDAEIEQKNERRKARAEEIFSQQLSSRADRLVRMVVDPTDEFIRWEQEQYKNQSHSSKLRRCRAAKFLGYRTNERDQLVREIERKAR